jgi:hypothetical protein
VPELGLGFFDGLPATLANVPVVEAPVSEDDDEVAVKRRAKHLQEQREELLVQGVEPRLLRVLKAEQNQPVY